MKSGTRNYKNIIVSLSLSFVVMTMQAAEKAMPLCWQQWLTSAPMRHATVTVEIAEVSQGEPLVALDGERAVMPASVLKLLTTATALRLCGAQHVVETQVGYTGHIDAQGTLQGNLVIKGMGDATLGSKYLQRPANAFFTAAVAAVKKAGIRRIAGNVYADASALPAAYIPNDWTWEDLGNYYAAGIYALNLYDNTYRLVLDTSHKGKQPQVQRVEPQVPGLTFENQLLPIDYGKDSAYIYGAPLQMQRSIYGAIPQKASTFAIKGDIPNPPLYVVQQLHAALVDAGVGVSGTDNAWFNASQLGWKPADVKSLYTHSSLPLGEVVHLTNLHSVNLFAEMLMRQVALKKADGTLYGGLQATLDYWKRQGLDVDGLQLYDACGLAPTNRVTAHFVAELLRKCRKDTAFVASLAKAGREGTVQNFLKGTRLEGKASLKTGTTKQVVAYAGYVTGNDKKTYVVVIFVNNYKGKASQVRKNIEKLLLLSIP